LKTAEGTRKRTLPRPVASNGQRQPRDARELLRSSLGDRWKSFRKRVRRGLPRRAGRREIDDAVHDLRTSARRLLSVLDSIDAIEDVKAVRRLSKRVKRILDRLSLPRDLSVEQSTLTRASGHIEAVRSFERQLDRDYQKSLRRSQRLLDRVKLDELRRDKRQVAKRLRRVRAGEKSVRRDLLSAARAALDRVRTLRASVNPSDVRTLHKLRIALKNFRYLMEAVSPIVPGTTKAALESLRALQTTLGDLHDIEVLSGALSGHLAGDSSATPGALSPVLLNLEAEHSGMLRSFLKSVDPILDYWTGLLPGGDDAGARL
jgi:CHAD domain-containing protein